MSRIISRRGKGTSMRLSIARIASSIWSIMVLYPGKGETRKAITWISPARGRLTIAD
jgi:hypothetical protein